MNPKQEKATLFYTDSPYDDQATSYVKQFHSIEGAAAKASEHYDFMVQSEAKLKDTVSNQSQLVPSYSGSHHRLTWSFLSRMGTLARGMSCIFLINILLIFHTIPTSTGYAKSTKCCLSFQSRRCLQILSITRPLRFS